MRDPEAGCAAELVNSQFSDDATSIVSGISCCGNISNGVSSIVSSCDVSSNGDVMSSAGDTMAIAVVNLASRTDDFSSSAVETMATPAVKLTARTCDSARTSKSLARKAAASASLLPSLIPKPRPARKAATAAETSSNVDLVVVAHPAATLGSRARQQQKRNGSVGCRGRQSARATKAEATRPHWRP
ncbi:hypothetical protein CLOM_g10857 [Closterium sp. NIES-68]|nr:hypothetical protein CLOM_g10857 [Closterium sp. NIES-68]GJP74814.1 hypothetical protein CLOP_g5348 [Closterium sp. NIES-67]GJP83027.1 hypothetical protein CLOP_g13238 [Closterium sp. NIES-67]